MSNGPISDLASELLQRELNKNPEQFKTKPVPQPNESGMSPHTLATIGGLLDAASTYAFMKRGTHKEGNALVNMIAGQQPEMTGLSAIGGLLATKAMTKLIGKKWPGVADAIAANLGAEQLGLGIHNLAKTFDKSHNQISGYDEYNSVLGRNRQLSSDSKLSGY